MNTDYEFETDELDIAAEFAGDEEFSRFRRLPTRTLSARPQSRPISQRRPPVGARRVYLVAPESTGASEYVRWVQTMLNQALNLQLPIDGVMSVQTRSAIRSFQEKNGLPVDGIVSPPTEAALMAVGKGQTPQVQSTVSEFETFDLEADASEWESEIARRRQSLPLTLGVAGDPRIIDLTAKADKRKRLLIRDPKKVYALVLHQMACCYNVSDPLTRYPQSMAAHFVILPDGRILQLHPLQAMTGASSGFNHGSVAVEFAGNFPTSNGAWWVDKEDVDKLRARLKQKKLPDAQIQARIQAFIKANQNQVTPEQIEAGRYLVRYLKGAMPLTHILAHCQSYHSRENDPGPDIWFHVGQWAIENLGLNDGGPGFKIDSGHPIPDVWRSWGRSVNQPKQMIQRFDQEIPLQPSPAHTAVSDFEAQDFERDASAWESEVNRNSRDYVKWVQQALNRILGLKLSADGGMGVQTRSAIRRFQRQQGLPADGVVGARTEAAIKAALGGSPPPAASASSPAATSGCNKTKRLTVGTTPVWSIPGDAVFFFKAGMSIDADGAPRAYHPQNKGLDNIGNAGHPGNWWGVLTDTRKRSGTPIIQAPGDPAPGYYVSTSSLTDSQYAATDPRHYVDATQIPYIALPNGKPAPYTQLGARLGDFAAVINTHTNRVAYAIFADVGPAGQIGEGSIALAQALGHNPFKSNGKAAIGIGSGIIYVVFPNSGNGQPRSLATINAEGARLFNNWGGLARATACLP